MQKSMLSHQFSTAFPAIKVSPDAVYDGSSERAEKDPEVQELIRYLGNKTWIEIKSEDIRTMKQSLPLLSDQAFVAYIPAFLKAGIVGLRAGDEDLFTWVMFSLCPETSDGKFNEYQESRLNLIPKEAAQVIAHLLSELGQTNIDQFSKKLIDKALQLYWEEKL